MSKHLSRRNVLTAGISTAGLFLGTSSTKSAPESQSRDSNPPFLAPWSPPPNLKRDLTPGDTPVRLACSAYRLNSPKDMGITEMVKRVHDKGYTSVGASFGLFNRNYWLDASESEIKELKDALKKYDVLFFDIHGAVNNIHPDLTERRKINNWIIEQMEAAERVGCPLVTTHVGSRAPGAVHPHPENWTWETWDLGVKVMKQILKDTEGMKCVLAIEPDSLVQINNPSSCRHLVDECGPRIQICLDPVNMSNLQMHYRKTEFLNECFDLLDEDIIICHAKDIALENSLQPMLKQVEPGKGTMDYETYLARLSRLKWPRTLLLEHLPAEKYPAVKKFIEDTAVKVGVKIYS